MDLKAILLVGILSMQGFGFSIPSVSVNALMQRIISPTLFSLYSKDYGMLYCQLYGVAGISRCFVGQDCEVTLQSLREMRHFAMQYVQNTIKLEQQFHIGYKRGWCFLQKGGNLLNAKVVRDGYAVVQYFDGEEEGVLKDLERLEPVARKEKRGLWREWEVEMNCLKETLREAAKGILAQEQ